MLRYCLELSFAIFYAYSFNATLQNINIFWLHV